MARATIVFEDGPEGTGTFKVDTDYKGGFQVASHAHQHALLCVKHLGAIAERFGSTQATEVRGTTPEAAADLARAMDEPCIDAVPIGGEPEYVDAPPVMNG